MVLRKGFFQFVRPGNALIFVVLKSVSFGVVAKHWISGRHLLG
jgi:hypothetical protein